MPEAVLNPPRWCCGKEFKLERAYNCHVAAHVTCERCEFTGSRAAVQRHAREVHGTAGAAGELSEAQLSAVARARAAGADAHPDTFHKRDGSTFTVVDEDEAVPVPLERRFPGTQLLWTVGDGRGAEDNAASGGPSEEPPAADAVPGPSTSEEFAWPFTAELRLVLVVGGSGSGKSALLRSLGLAGRGEAPLPPWPTGRSILDGLGGCCGDGETDAFGWLGAVGLGSVPLWCQPYAALSTGEAFRAELARRLQRAAATRRPLVVDSFCDHLDPLSAACCSAALARHLRGPGAATRAVLASCHPGTAHWLRPDAVVVCRDGAPPVLLRNAGSAARLPLQIRVDPGQPDASGGGGGGGGEGCVQRIRNCGLRIVAERCLGDSAAEGTPDPADGGHVLVSRVATSEATAACDTLFDLPHDGTCTRRLPRFPSAEERGGPTARGEASSPRRGCPLGLITGPSGSAKSALLRLHFGEARLPEWVGGATLESMFDDDEQAARCLGASALPEAARAWRAGCTSSGEAAQAHLALALATAERGAAAAEADSPGSSASPGWPTGAAADAAGRGLALFDEFGSAWDERTARRVSAALSGALDRGECRARGVVLAGCHASVLGRDALRPDWIFEAGSGTCFCVEASPLDGEPAAAPAAAPAATSAAQPAELATIHEHEGLDAWEARAQEASLPGCACDGVCGFAGRIRVGLPELRLRLRPGSPAEWPRFASFHYKSGALSKFASAFLLEARLGATLGPASAGAASVPVGFVATIPHSGRRSAAARAAPHRAHRTVVLPEWQGFGIGSRLSDAAAEWHSSRGSDYYGQTVHPRFGGYRDASPLWEPTEYNHTAPQLRITGWRARQDGVAIRLRRPKTIFAHRYLGGADGGGDGDAGAGRRRQYLAERVAFGEV